MGKFANQVRAFVDVAKEDMRYVATEAIQDVVEAAQTTQLGVTRGADGFEEGKIPVGLTADLVNSLTSSLNGGGETEGPDGYTTVIANFDLGDSMRFAWPMEYAMRVEHGFTGTDELGRKFNQAGRHFVGANVARFPEFVEARVREVRGK
ncbi:hypothetical protein QEZ52_00295 [Aliisedimentitalea scapharcae]|uniref:HK97 gp10 family phage protein n=1 Tax=Aliisedimentitalea scapharcae TaxID=1524259 RepID=A0ABZ2XTL6_9RHOB